jgi:hypothetical protein
VAFPTPPFKIETKPDGVLVEYLKRAGNFSFLAQPTREIINKLKDDNLMRQDQELLDLWPLVL